MITHESCKNNFFFPMGSLKVCWNRNDQRGDILKTCILKTGLNKVHYKSNKTAWKGNKKALLLLENTVCQMSFDCSFKLVEFFNPFDIIGKWIPVMYCTVKQCNSSNIKNRLIFEQNSNTPLLPYKAQPFSDTNKKEHSFMLSRLAENSVPIPGWLPNRRTKYFFWLALLCKDYSDIMNSMVF